MSSLQKRRMKDLALCVAFGGVLAVGIFIGACAFTPSEKPVDLAPVTEEMTKISEHLTNMQAQLDRLESLQADTYNAAASSVEVVNLKRELERLSVRNAAVEGFGVNRLDSAIDDLFERIDAAGATGSEEVMEAVNDSGVTQETAEH